jgi:hypothetical protein
MTNTGARSRAATWNLEKEAHDEDAQEANGIEIGCSFRPGRREQASNNARNVDCMEVSPIPGARARASAVRHLTAAILLR